MNERLALATHRGCAESNCQKAMTLSSAASSTIVNGLADHAKGYFRNTECEKSLNTTRLK
jgi:hypothetical protein